MPNKNKFRLIVLSLFVILLFSVSLNNFYPKKVSAFNFFGSVLGDDDKEDSEDDENEEDQDEEDSEDSDSKDEQESEDEVENENETKDEEETEEKETRTTTLNSDGTRTVTKTKIEDNGKIEIESKTYGVNGKIIEELKSKDENGKTELELEAENLTTGLGKISEMKYKSKSGEEFKLMIKNADKTITKVVYDANNNYVRVIGNTNPQGVADNLTLKENDDDSYELEHNGKTTEVKLPITVDDESGDVLLLTDSGEKALEQLPDQIATRVENKGETNIIRSQVTEKNGKVVYELTTEKAQNILGLFETRIDSLLTYDATTGLQLETTQSFWNKVLDLISF